MAIPLGAKEEVIAHLRSLKSDELPNKEGIAALGHYLVDIQCLNCYQGKIESYAVAHGKSVLLDSQSVECPICKVKGQWKTLEPQQVEKCQAEHAEEKQTRAKKGSKAK